MRVAVRALSAAASLLGRAGRAPRLHLAANTIFGRTCSMFLAAASAGSRSDHRIAVKQTIAMGTISLLFIDRLLRAL